MSVTIKEVSGRRLRKQFIHLPARIHKGHTNWVPPIYMDDRAYFNSRKNKSFHFSDVKLFLAFRDGLPVGRIMGIINKRYNESKSERHVRFCFLECWDSRTRIHRAC